MDKAHFREKFNIDIPVEFVDKIVILDEDSGLYRFDGLIESYDYPGFYIIPSFERYVISKEAVVIDTLKKRVKTWTIWKDHKGIRKGGYHTTVARNNFGVRKSFTRHRVMALTFIPMKLSDQKLVVNHKNGIPGDDRIENLEWVTYSENNAHAYDCGLYKPGRLVPVVYFNRNTGEERRFKSVFECMRYLGKKETYIRLRVAKPQLMFDDGIDIKVDDGKPWPMNRTFKKVPKLRQIASRDVFNGKIGLYKSAQQAMQITGVKEATISFHCGNRVNVPTKGFNFRFYEKGEVFPIHGDHTLKLLSSTDASITGYGYILSDDSGKEIDIVYGIKKLSEILNLKQETLIRIISNGSKTPNGITITPYDPKNIKEYTAPLIRND